jgi:hypothetical protein
MRSLLALCVTPARTSGGSSNRLFSTLVASLPLFLLSPSSLPPLPPLSRLSSASLPPLSRSPPSPASPSSLFPISLYLIAYWQVPTPRVALGFCGLVGRTPLVRLDSLSKETGWYDTKLSNPSTCHFSLAFLSIPQEVIYAVRV